MPATTTSAGGESAARALSLRVTILVAAAFTLLAGWTLLTSARVVIWSYLPVPFWDGWVEALTARSWQQGQFGLSELFAQHNEHRIVLSRPQFLLDMLVFGGRQVFLLGMIALSSVLLALVLAFPVVSVWRDRLVTFGFTAFALAAVLTPAGHQNLTWGFQVGFVQAYLFAAVAIALAVYTFRASLSSRREAVLTVLVIVATSASTYSSGQGLVLWPIVLAALFLVRVRPRVLVAVGVAGALVIASYLHGLEPAAGVPPKSDNVRHPLGLVHYALTYLGHPAGALGQNVATAWGVVGMTMLLVLLVAAVRRRSSEAHRTILFGAAVASFVVVTALQTAVGRLGFGVAQALSSRYAVGAAVFWVALAVGLAPLVARTFEVRIRSRGGHADATGVAYAGAWLLVAFAASVAGAPPKADIVEARVARDVAVASFASGVRDDAALERLHPSADLVADNLRWLRSEHLAPWGTSYGSSLARAERSTPPPGGLARCRGNLDATRPVTGGTRFEGWIVAPGRERTATHLGVVDGSGASHGIGVVGVPRPDVAAAGITRSSYRGFVAYARAPAPPVLSLVLAAPDGRPACALRVP